ncbi:MAG: C45 family peptidase [Myxococcota bacterium]
MQVIELAGEPFDMGVDFGRQARDEIGELYRLRLANAIAQAREYGARAVDEEWLTAVSERCLPYVQAHHREGFDELRGIAEGSGRPLAQIWSMNALTDLRDVAAFSELPAPSALPEGEGCSSIVVHSDASTSGPLVGQTWDLGTDNMPFVRIVRRRPRRGPSTTSLTTVGCLSLIGANDQGLAVGTTNLRSSDARLGVGYLDVIHRMLASRTFEEARDSLLTAHRSGAHYFYLASADGRLSTFEGTAGQVRETAVASGFLVHCNHMLHPENVPLEVRGTPTASTHHRQERLEALARASSPLGPEDLRDFFADGEGAELAINRKDYGGISSNGSVVVAPARGELWAVHGPADVGRWERFATS